MINNIYILLLISTSFLVFSCTINREVRNSRKNYSHGTPALNKLNVTEHFSGICSYYGIKFHGRKTANGEVYDMNKFTAAHKTLPFGTKLLLTNPLNKETVIVRINDCGPFVRGRILDLSYAAAKKLKIIKPGTAKLDVKIIYIPKK